MLCMKSVISMSKLEQKLIELGYKPYEQFMLIHSFIKVYNDKSGCPIAFCSRVI